MDNVAAAKIEAPETKQDCSKQKEGVSAADTTIHVEQNGSRPKLSEYSILTHDSQTLWEW